MLVFVLLTFIKSSNANVYSNRKVIGLNEKPLEPDALVPAPRKHRQACEFKAWVM